MASHFPASRLAARDRRASGGFRTIQKDFKASVITFNRDRFISGAEDEMRKIITIAIIVATATITAAWSVSTQPSSPNRGAQMVGGGGTPPTHSVLSW
jgi:hypothetical protein